MRISFFVEDFDMTDKQREKLRQLIQDLQNGKEPYDEITLLLEMYGSWRKVQIAVRN